MEAQIKDEIQKMSKITLNQKDFIARGQYGQVYRYQIQNTPLAVKCFETEKEAKQEKNVIETIHSIANDCPGITQYYGMKQLQIEIKGVVNQNYIGYVTFIQLCSCDLSQINALPIQEIFNLLSQLSLSLFCLHSNGFFHGDVKPANILADNYKPPLLNYYLTDYGTGKCVKDLITTNYNIISLRGTPHYFDPELWEIFNTRANFGYYNPLASDIYALGIICLEQMIGKNSLYQLSTFRSQEQQYANELLKIEKELLKRPQFQNSQNNQLLMMLLRMVSFHQKDRPQAIEICQALIASNFFQIDALETKSLKALIVQLISSFTPKIKTSIPENQQVNPIPIMPSIPSVQIPTFASDIIKNSAQSSLILSLFEDSAIKLQRIHHQKITNKSFDIQKFHSECDNKGPTLVILHSNDESDSLFGGMAVSSWQSLDSGRFVDDPADQCSWMFKIEQEGKQIKLHQWKCIDKSIAIFCHKKYGPCFGESESKLQQKLDLQELQKLQQDLQELQKLESEKLQKIEQKLDLQELQKLQQDLQELQQQQELKLDLQELQELKLDLQQELQKSKLKLQQELQKLQQQKLKLQLSVYDNGKGRSYITANNEYYKKFDLTSQMNNGKSLLFQLKKIISIVCPLKVVGKIMNEEEFYFPLSECEIFAIKK